MGSIKNNTILLILGHGSTENKNSSKPTKELAKIIEKNASFSKVKIAFWKEQPNFHEIFQTIKEKYIYILPYFISEGYFTQEVIPRELGINTFLSYTKSDEFENEFIKNNKVIRFCPPIGLSQIMTDILASNAKEYSKIIEKNKDKNEKITVLIVGHGTSLNKNSKNSIFIQVEKVKKILGINYNVLPAFMDEKPFIKDWETFGNTTNFIIIPFFISDGLHTFEDIPEMIGFERVMNKNKYIINKKSVYYCDAIGKKIQTKSAKIIEKYCTKWHNKCHNSSEKSENYKNLSSEKINVKTINSSFDKQNNLQLGEVLIKKNNNNSFILSHIKNKNLDASKYKSLRNIQNSDEIENLISIDDNGDYRPLKSQKNLPTNWIFMCDSEKNLLNAIEIIYPLAIHNLKFNPQAIVNLNEKLHTQTGMYKNIKYSDSSDNQEIKKSICDTKCIKKRVWDLKNYKNTDGFEIFCHAPCNFLIEKIRKKMPKRTKKTTTLAH